MVTQVTLISIKTHEDYKKYFLELFFVITYIYITFLSVTCVTVKNIAVSCCKLLSYTVTHRPFLSVTICNHV